ncbi:MAG: alpha/beta hydrolase [Ruminococcaceae bacterium]|nr:alpha/beta hydrolase [Oscillospiraceae bacterium]
MPENKFTPCVILPGIGQSKVEMIDKKGEKIKMAWPIDVDGEALMNELKGSLMKMMLFRKDAGFSDKVASVVKDIADPIASNPDGSMKNTLRTVSYPRSLAECSADEKRYIYKMVPLNKLSDIIGEENLYFFSYNSFGDTYETAKELSSFIDMVKEKTGSDKVNLVPVSLGGALSTAYFQLFRQKHDVKRVMYFVAALGGSHLIADIMAKNVDVSNGLSMVEMLANAKTAESLGGLLKMMPEGVFEKTVDKVLDVLISQVLMNSLSIWGIIPPERYPALSEKYLSDKAHGVLKEKADSFYEYRLSFPSVVRELEGEGVEFFAVCGYGLKLLPLCNSSFMSSDGIIHVGSTTLGALSAPAGEELCDFPAEGKVCTDPSHSHLSPDKNVDAAYGLWPERTWYFASQGHDAIAYNDTALEIAARVLSDDSFTDIYSDDGLPQFGTVQDNRK